MEKVKSKIKAKNLMIKLAQGLTGFMAYESKCGMSSAYSEYFFYSPIVRMAVKDWIIKSEKSVLKRKKIVQGKQGDFERIDFHFINRRYWKNSIAFEVKYISYKNYKSLDIQNDKKKLKSLLTANGRRKAPYKLSCFILFVGKHSQRYKRKIKQITKIHKIPIIIEESFISGKRTYGVTVVEVD